MGESELSDTTRVVILTGEFRVEGNLALGPSGRLTDLLRETRGFIAVTDAVVNDLRTGGIILAAKFLDVNLARIEIVHPIEGAEA
jgi:hypothetical protein